MSRLPLALALLGLLFASTAEYAFSQEAPNGKPQQRLPVAVMKSWEKAEKQVQRNRETYDKANEKVIAGLQKDLEKVNPPVKVEEIIEQFQKDAIAQLDAEAKPPAPPPPDKGVAVFNGHRYKLVLENLSWEDAKQKCEGMGGHLLTIENRAELEFMVKVTSAFLKQNQDMNTESRVWLGMKRDKANGQFVPLNGQPQLFSNWLEGSPKPNEDFVQMYFQNGLWTSRMNSAEPIVFYICEWDK